MHVSRIDQFPLQLPGAPIASGFDGIAVEARREGPFSGSFGAESDLLIMRHTGGEMAADVYYRDRVYSRTLPEGGILIIPPQATFRLHLSEHGTNLYAALALPTLRPPTQPTASDLSRPLMIASDPVLDGLLDMSRNVIDFPRSVAGGILDILSDTIIAHIGRLQAASERERPPACPDRSSNAIITRAVDYMVRNVDRSFTLSDVGSHVRCSPSHIGRLFKAHLGVSPHRHLLGLRIERARLLLVTTDLPIVQIALECGFASQEHLTRHFRRQTGTTPAAYRRAQTRAQSSTQLSA